MGLNVVFIGLRVWTRATISHNFNFNDVFMMVAMVRRLPSLATSMADELVLGSLC